ncbi:MAG: hypothetical protein JWR26_3617 [Pedosphaera sp.]|nr:hypothetical protein [Pedosphaera sp.]
MADTSSFKLPTEPRSTLWGISQVSFPPQEWDDPPAKLIHLIFVVQMRPSFRPVESKKILKLIKDLIRVAQLIQYTLGIFGPLYRHILPTCEFLKVFNEFCDVPIHAHFSDSRLQ